MEAQYVDSLIKGLPLNICQWRGQMVMKILGDRKNMMKFLVFPQGGGVISPKRPLHDRTHQLTATPSLLL